MPRKTHRRDFLKGKSAAQAAGELVEKLVGEPLLDPGGDGDSYLVRVGRRAMACEFEVLLNVGQYPDGTAAAVEALDLVDELEQQMTVYRDTSEISALNARAYEEPVEVEARLFQVLQLGARLYQETGGAYDLTAGPLSKIWGFYRRAGRVPTDAELAETMQHVGTDKLELDHERRTVRFRVPGMEINLGSIGKGYALDRCAELLARRGMEHYMLHGGQSSVICRGSRGYPLPSAAAAQQGWWIGIRDPYRTHQRLAELRVLNRAMATSGSGIQFFIHEGKRFGHILDPRTGRPAEGVLSATILAPTGAEADALSTACYVMGREAALGYCAKRPELGLVLISPGKNPGSIDVVTQGIAVEDIRWLQSSTAVGSVRG